MSELPDKRIGFVSFRFAGTDGVSLESSKWADVLESLGWECFYLAGEFEADNHADSAHYMCEPLLQFFHPEIKNVYDRAFGTQLRREIALTHDIHALRTKIKERLYDFVNHFKISTLLVENALTIPLNLPLGMALTEFLSESGTKCIAHHHDFFWERKRFTNNCVHDILHSSYPPNLPNMVHVTINSDARTNLGLRTGISATLIPNVMHFEHAPPAIDAYSSDFRQNVGIGKDTICILQPTRVVQRKGIEHSIELVARMRDKIDKEIVLLISHASGDEGFEYEQRLHEYTELLSVPTIFESEIICDKRIQKNERKCYSLQDVYPHANLVAYPSLFEGFGNAFLEAVYFKKLIVVNNYSVYVKDIKPQGFSVVEFDNFISSGTINDITTLLREPARIQAMVDKNYAIGLQHFSYRILRIRLKYIISELWGSIFE